MASTQRDKLNKLYTHLAPGTPLTSEDLTRLGISADLAVHYVRAGWLERLARGVRQYVSPRPVLHFYGWKAGRLPDWFTHRFPAEYHRKRLFDERPNALLHVRPFEDRKGAPLVSAPERALLEVLSEVGVRQPLQEARELVESSYSLRADALRDLLKRCTSVKTVRLCLQLGRERSQPWFGKLDQSQLPKGSNRPWVSRS